MISKVYFELDNRHFVLVQDGNGRRVIDSSEVQWSENDIREVFGTIPADVALAYAHRALDRVPR